MNALQDHDNIYKHLQLSGDREQIRLLRLINFDWNTVAQNSFENSEPLEFELAVYDFLDAPVYEAVSYAWGEATPTRAIFVDDVEVKVGENCHYALSQARLQDAKHIWIDAICINQQDLDAKGQQVAMMYSIFSRAHRVLACIGPADDNSDRILAQMPVFRLHDPQAFQHARDSLSGQTFWENWGHFDWKTDLAVRKWIHNRQPRRSPDATGQHPEYSESRVQFCRDFNALLQRRYFKRLWIAQEIYGGGINCLFLVGRNSFSLLDLRYCYVAALVTCYRLSQQCEKPVSVMLDMLQMLAKQQRYGSGTTPYLRFARYLLCSDVRDRIYATLGVDSYDLKASIVPDYNKSAFDLALNLSQVNRFDFQGLQNSVEALAIEFHHPRLASCLAERSLICPAGSTEVTGWRVRFLLWRIVDRLEPLKLQDGMETLEFKGPASSGEKHESCEGADANDRLRFALQCDQLLREQKVIKGVAGSALLRDKWVLPATTKVGDIILSAADRSANGASPTRESSKTAEDLALVVRIGIAAETCTIVGFATCIIDTEGGLIGDTMRQRWRDQSWWSHADIWFRATSEEMMPLAIPQRDSRLHARHAFKLPKCSYMEAMAGSSGHTVRYWSRNDGHGVMSGGDIIRSFPELSPP